jgi:hypothetical protein
MTREFTHNMFIMLLAIMIGAIIITYFAADVINRTTIETITSEHREEITNIQSSNENFTSNFLKSAGLLDQAREGRAFGNYHFDLAFLWYNSALLQKNQTTIDLYKNRAVENCTNAMPKYMNSYNNFESSKERFQETKTFTNHPKYIEVLDLYINLTESGSRLTMLRYDASNYLKQITENLTITIENNTVIVVYATNISGLLGLFNETIAAYEGELETFEEIQDELDEYEFFDEIR